MHELSLMAATEWAKARAPMSCDPVEFGRCVSQVYWAAKKALPVEDKGLEASDEILKAACFLPQQPGDEDPEAPISETPRPKSPSGAPAASARVSPLDAGVTLGDLVRSATVLVDADGWFSGLGQRAAGPQQSRS